MGKPKIMQKRKDLFIEKVWRAYQSFGSCRKAAPYLGVSYQTVRRYLKEAGYELHKRGGEHAKGKSIPSYHFGCLANWLREHPGEKLPRSPQDIAELTGCSLNAVKSYLYRRRKAARKASSSVSP